MRNYLMDAPDTTKVGWKNTYRNMTYNGYVWGGWLADEGLHLFQKKERDTNGFPIYTTVKCRDSELFDASPKDGRSSFQMLCDAGYTR